MVFGEMHSVVLTDTGNVLVAGADPKRVYIAITPSIAQFIVVSTNPFGQDIPGWLIPASGHPLILTIDEVGLLVAQPFYARGDTGGVTIGVITASRSQ